MNEQALGQPKKEKRTHVTTETLTSIRRSLAAGMGKNRLHLARVHVEYVVENDMLHFVSTNGHTLQLVQLKHAAPQSGKRQRGIIADELGSLRVLAHFPRRG